MMQLKYLFDNVPVSLMLLKNWDFDSDTINTIKPFRTSANAVYQFYNNNDKETFYLRFAPLEEKDPVMVQSELDFLEYLHDNGYNAVESVKSKDGSNLVVQNTPWGKYLAVVFKAVPGKPIEKIEYSDLLYYNYGKSLGKLHKLSSNYKHKKVRRPDWKEQLEYIRDILKEYSAPSNSLCEVEILYKFFLNLNVNSENYGLVHYDFETDNVFFDENSGIYSVIDFDDAIYHWYIIDIEQAVDYIQNELSENFQNQAHEQFLSGYRSEKNIDNDMLSLLPIFKRYVNLYGFARCLRSIHEEWNNEPEWVTGLRAKLKNAMSKRSEEFGAKINI